MFNIHGLAFGYRSDLDSFRSGKALGAPGAFIPPLTRPMVRREEAECAYLSRRYTVSPGLA